jgi:hypothetical protein
LRIEEFDDALAFADDLRGHSPTAAATEAAAPSTAAAESAATAAAAKAAAIAEATAAAIAAARAAATTTAAVSAAILKSAAVTKTCFFEKPVALVFPATATIAFAPSIETHSVQTSVCPDQVKNQRAGPRGATGLVRFLLTHGSAPYMNFGGCSSDSIAQGWQVGRQAD